MKLFSWITGGWYDLAPITFDKDVIFAWERQASVLEMMISIGTEPTQRVH